jgi:hypothetical protein
VVGEDDVGEHECAAGINEDTEAQELPGGGETPPRPAPGTPSGVVSRHRTAR